jgi:hypothetical protein
VRACSQAHRKDLAAEREGRRVGEGGGELGPVGPVDLVDRDRDRQAGGAGGGTAQQLGDEAVTGPEALHRIDHQQAAVGVGEL